MTRLSTTKEQRRQYAYVGFCMTAMLILGFLLPNLSALTMRFLWPGYARHPWVMMSVNYGLYYLLAYPYVILLLRLRTVGVPPKNKMKFHQLLAAIPVCSALTYFGNIIGSILNQIIGLMRGTVPDNQLEGLVDQLDPWIILVFVVIVGPIMEELLFRKALTDALYPFGETACICLGALIFGLIHGNFYQFFYAFLVGALLTLIYCRTGKLRYTIFLHMFLNFQGSIIAPKIISLIDITLLSEGKVVELFTQNPWGTLVYIGYTIFLLAFNLLGTVLLILGYKKLPLKSAAVPMKHPLLSALCNVGIPVFLVCAAVMIVIQL